MAKTPKKFRGFEQLPEAVQQKMNPEAAVKYMEGGAVKKPDVSMYMDGGSVEINGVMDESYVKPRKASKKGGTEAGNARGGGAALRGTRFSGVK
jgi:hypothetical protein|tara:strand:+ start:322 stop:603 length:282 start_codon:yes stop_codon:yes gene_type:complete